MFRKMMIGAATLAASIMTACASGDEQAALTDMKIAHIAYTAGQIDMRYAHLALALSKDEDVRAFARIMLQDHKAVNDAALELLNRLGATPEDNPTSQSLLAQADENVAKFKALEGAAFDQAYAENELAYHQFVNKTVEETFIPSVQNEEFKELLGVALATFKAHEGHAEKMVEAVQ